MPEHNISRRNFLSSAAAAAFAFGCFGAGGCSGNKESVQRAPNIVFIMADDMGYGDLGCYGATKIPTPNIDRMAAEGIRFTDAHSPASLCTPTRYSVLTGRYCWRSKLTHGVLKGFDPLLIDTARPTVASILKKAGYTTAAIGKWHLGLGDKTPVDFSGELKPSPLELGFDYFFGFPASLDMPPYCFVENHRTVGELSEEKSPYHTLQSKGMMTPGWRDEEVGPTLTAKAVQFIEKNAERPFFLYLPYQAPHTPCTPPDFIKGRSGAGVRGDMVTELDWAVGRILDTLKENGLDENTLIILTSDNGALTTGPYSWRNDPPEKYDLVHNGHKPNGDLRGQKSDIYDGGHREPFIARWPGTIAPGRVSNEIVCLTDLLATAAAVASLELPSDAGGDSFNILPVLTGENSGPVRESVIHHSGSGVFSIRRANWKLIMGRGSGGFTWPKKIDPAPGKPKGQLYDMDSDPAEKNNLWDSEPGIRKNLISELQGYIDRGRSTPGPDLTNFSSVDIWGTGTDNVRSIE